MLSDDRLVFVGANKASDRILGVYHQQFVGKSIEEAFPGLQDTEVPARYREAAKNGRIWQTEQIQYDEGRISGAFEVVAFQTEPGKMAALSQSEMKNRMGSTQIKYLLPIIFKMFS